MLRDVDIDLGVANIFVRLRNVLQRAGRAPFPTTRLHDLTCFVVHRLLRLSPAPGGTSRISECLRYAMVLFMLITHGPTYYSHGELQASVVGRLREQLGLLEPEQGVHDGRLHFWILAVAMVSSAETAAYPQFLDWGCEAAVTLELKSGSDAMEAVKRILWLPSMPHEAIFQSHWDAVLGEAQEQAIVRASCSATNDLSMVCRDQHREWV